MNNKLQYIKRVVKNATFDKMTRQIEQAHLRSGKNKLYIAADMVKSFVFYGAGYYDYVIFEFWNLSHKQRKTYLTRFKSKKLITQLNDCEYSHYFDNKDEFNEKFRKYIGRDFISVKNSTFDEVKEFYFKNDEIFAKMRDLSCGIGCEKLFKSDFTDAISFYDYIKRKGFATLEEVLKNHPDIDKIYPFSVNTLRIITIVDAECKAHCIYAVFKMGNNNRIVDNYGLHGPVDIKTGRFLFAAHCGDTTANEHFTSHPYSNTELVGMKVPMVNEAVELALKAALVVPQMRYIGWDIAITPDGPAIIEGNNYCAHDFWQLPGQTPDGIGILPKIKEIVPEIKL